MQGQVRDMSEVRVGGEQGNLVFQGMRCDPVVGIGKSHAFVFKRSSNSGVNSGGRVVWSQCLERIEEFRMWGKEKS